MHTSLLCKCGDAPPGRKYIDAWESYAAMVNRSGIVIGMAGFVIWDVGRASCVLGMTLVCRALMKIRAATRMISIVTRKAITTGLMDESPTRCSGVGLLAVGFCTLMDGLDAEVIVWG